MACGLITSVSIAASAAGPRFVPWCGDRRPPIRAAKSHIALCDKHNFAFAQLSTVRSPSHIAFCDLGLAASAAVVAPSAAF